MNSFKKWEFFEGRGMVPCFFPDISDFYKIYFFHVGMKLLRSDWSYLSQALFAHFSFN